MQPTIRARLWITDQKQFYTSGDTIQGKLFLGASDSLNMKITRIEMVLVCEEHYRIKDFSGSHRHHYEGGDSKAFLEKYNSKKGVDKTLKFEIKLNRDIFDHLSVRFTDFGVPDLGIMWSLRAEITASPIGERTQDTQVIERTTGFDFYPLNFDDLTSNIAMLSASTPTMKRWMDRDYSFELAYPKVIPQRPQTFALELSLTLVEPVKFRSASVFILKRVVFSNSRDSEVITHRTRLTRLEPNVKAPMVKNLVVHSSNCQLAACEPGPIVSTFFCLSYTLCVELELAGRTVCAYTDVIIEPVSHLRAMEKAESKISQGIKNLPISEASLPPQYSEK